MIGLALFMRYVEISVNSKKFKVFFVNLQVQIIVFYFTGIYFRVIGYGKCNWMDLMRRDSIPVESKKNERSDIKFWGDEEYINATVYVIGSKNGMNQLAIK